MPTQPNNPDDPDERTPCEVLKENSSDPVIQGKIDSLKGLVALSNPQREHHETAITVNKRGSVMKYKVFNKGVDIGMANAVTVQIELDRFDIMIMHNHFEGTFPLPQFGDIKTFYTGYKISPPIRRNAYTFYTLNYNGTEYAFRMNDTTAMDALFAGLHQDTVTSTNDEDKVARQKIYDIYEAYGFDKEQYIYTESEALKIVMKVLNDPKIGSGNGVHLYRKDKNNNRWAKLKLNPDGTMGQDDCPL